MSGGSPPLTPRDGDAMDGISRPATGMPGASSGAGHTGAGAGAASAAGSQLNLLARPRTPVPPSASPSMGTRQGHHTRAQSQSVNAPSVLLEASPIASHGGTRLTVRRDSNSELRTGPLSPSTNSAVAVLSAPTIGRKTLLGPLPQSVLAHLHPSLEQGKAEEQQQLNQHAVAGAAPTPPAQALAAASGTPNEIKAPHVHARNRSKQPMLSPLLSASELHSDDADSSSTAAAGGHGSSAAASSSSSAAAAGGAAPAGLSSAALAYYIPSTSDGHEAHGSEHASDAPQEREPKSPVLEAHGSPLPAEFSSLDGKESTASSANAGSSATANASGSGGGPTGPEHVKQRSQSLDPLSVANRPKLPNTSLHRKAPTLAPIVRNVPIDLVLLIPWFELNSRWRRIDGRTRH